MTSHEVVIHRLNKIEKRLDSIESQVISKITKDISSSNPEHKSPTYFVDDDSDDGIYVVMHGSKMYLEYDEDSINHYFKFSTGKGYFASELCVEKHPYVKLSRIIYEGSWKSPTSLNGLKVDLCSNNPNYWTKNDNAVSKDYIYEPDYRRMMILAVDMLGNQIEFEEQTGGCSVSISFLDSLHKHFVRMYRGEVPPIEELMS